MEPWVMWVVGLAVAALPVALMAAFNGADVLDSRGRRLNRTWRTPKPRLSGRRSHTGR